MQAPIAGLRARLRRDGPAGRLLRTALHPYSLLAFLCLAVWSLRGFNIGPVNDCWFQLAAVTSEGGFFRDNVTRVFGAIPMWLGIRLGDGGFQGVQLVILVLAWLRGVLFLEIMRRLMPGRPLMALSAGLVALFPFSDNSYFWLGASGLQFSLVTALAACLCALEYLEQPSRPGLLLALVFQLLSAFTYPGFLPLMALLPALGWMLQRGARKPVPFRPLLELNVVLLVAVLVYGLFLLDNSERNARVLDLQGSALSGYAWAGRTLLTSPLELFSFLTLAMGLLALLGALYAWLVLETREDVAPPPEPLQRQGWLLGGLLAMAAFSYLPYAFTTVRFSESRALLGAGIFFYTAFAVILLWVLERGGIRRIAPVAVALLAGLVLLNGIQKRDVWVKAYRAEEGLLAALARELPAPKPGSFVLVRLGDARQAREMQGFYNREPAFSFALQYLYGDLSLNGGFYGFGTDRAQFQTGGFMPRDRSSQRYRVGQVAYMDLVVFDYPRHGAAHFPAPTELTADTSPPPGVLAGYAPPPSEGMPGPDARMCRMLETRLRPSYCGR